MEKSKPFMYIPHMIDPATLIRRNDIIKYRNSVKVGDRVDGPRGIRPIILAKYKHIAITSQGCFQWIDLYMHNVCKADCTDTDYKYFVS